MHNQLEQLLTLQIALQKALHCDLVVHLDVLTVHSLVNGIGWVARCLLCQLLQVIAQCRHCVEHLHDFIFVSQVYFAQSFVLEVVSLASAIYRHAIAVLLKQVQPQLLYPPQRKSMLLR